MGGMTMRGVIVYRQSCIHKEIIKKENEVQRNS